MTSPNFILIFLCLAMGFLLRLSGRFPPKSPQAFNSFVIWVSLPAVVLLQIPKLLQQLQLNFQILIPITMPWVLFLLSFWFFKIMAQTFTWSNTKTGALILTAGLGNTSFVGFPLLESIYGAESLRIGVLVDQAGTFLTLSTLGLIVATLYSPTTGRTLSWRSISKSILQFPPFIALLLAIAWSLSGWHQADHLLLPVLERLAATLVPLALVSVGFQLKISRPVFHEFWRPVAVGLFFKLMLAPLFFLLCYRALLLSLDLQAKTTILEAAMAPMITASVVAEEFELDKNIASLMVGVGIPLSLLTVYLWSLVI